MFSHSRRLLSILETFLMGVKLMHRRVDGNSPASSRHEIAAEPNAENEVHLCSCKGEQRKM